MKTEKPQFELTRVYADAPEGAAAAAAEIVPVTQMPWDTKMNRRDALGVGMTATAVMLLLTGCGENPFSNRVAQEVEIPDTPDAQRKSPASVLQAHKQSVVKLFFQPIQPRSFPLPSTIRSNNGPSPKALCSEK